MAEMQYKTRNVSSNVLTEITPTSTLSDLSAPHQPIVPYFFVSLPLNHPKKTMHIRLVKSDKKRFLDLLLLADEQESMIDRYIERSDLFVMEEKGEAKAVAVVTREGQGVYELKNLAVAPACQRKGYGRMMVEHVWHYYADCRTLLVGTGDSPLTLPFYRSCGFTYSHTLPDFFTRHYDHPIIEGGMQLKDMIYLKRERQNPKRDSAAPVTETEP